MTKRKPLLNKIVTWLEIHQQLAIWITAGATSFIFLVTTVYALVSFCQLRMTQRQLNAMQSAERGHVMLTQITVHGIREIAQGSEAEGPIYLTYTMTNYGRTPAWSTNRTFKVDVKDQFYLPTRVPEYEDPRTSDNTVYPVLPNNPFDSGKFVVQHFQVTKQDAKDILAQCADPEGFDPKCKKNLFVYGSIEYRDVFQNCHVSRFAFLYRFKGDNPADAYRMPVGVPWYWGDEEKKCENHFP